MSSALGIEVLATAAAEPWRSPELLAALVPNLEETSPVSFEIFVSVAGKIIAMSPFLSNEALLSPLLQSLGDVADSLSRSANKVLVSVFPRLLLLALRVVELRPTSAALCYRVIKRMVAQVDQSRSRATTKAKTVVPSYVTVRCVAARVEDRLHGWQRDTDLRSVGNNNCVVTMCDGSRRVLSSLVEDKGSTAPLAAWVEATNEGARPLDASIALIRCWLQQPECGRIDAGSRFLAADAADLIAACVTASPASVLPNWFPSPPPALSQDGAGFRYQLGFIVAVGACEASLARLLPELRRWGAEAAGNTHTVALNYTAAAAAILCSGQVRIDVADEALSQMCCGASECTDSAVRGALLHCIGYAFVWTHPPGAAVSLDLALEKAIRRLLARYNSLENALCSHVGVYFAACLYPVLGGDVVPLLQPSPTCQVNLERLLDGLSPMGSARPWPSEALTDIRAASGAYVESVRVAYRAMCPEITPSQPAPETCLQARRAIRLPVELCEVVLSYLGAKRCISAAAVSSDWRAASRSSGLWKQFYALRRPQHLFQSEARDYCVKRGWIVPLSSAIEDSVQECDGDCPSCLRYGSRRVRVKNRRACRRRSDQHDWRALYRTLAESNVTARLKLASLSGYVAKVCPVVGCPAVLTSLARSRQHMIRHAAAAK